MMYMMTTSYNMMHMMIQHDEHDINSCDHMKIYCSHDKIMCEHMKTCCNDMKIHDCARKCTRFCTLINSSFGTRVPDSIFDMKIRDASPRKNYSAQTGRDAHKNFYTCSNGTRCHTKNFFITHKKFFYTL